MKIVEIVLGVLGFIGLSLLSQHYDGSAILTAISLVSLALFYFIGSVALLNQISLKTIFRKSSFEGISSLRIVGSIAYGVVLSAAIISVLFKVNHFPGSHIMLWISLISLVLGIVVATIRYLPQKNTLAYYPLLIRTIIWLAPVAWLIVR